MPDLTESMEATSMTGHLQTIDVTIPLQCLVKDSKLILHNTEKVGVAFLSKLNHSLIIVFTLFLLQSELPGFYDPCIGEEKLLKISYIYNGKNCELVFKDNEPLRIPPPNQSGSPTTSGEKRLQ